MLNDPLYPDPEIPDYLEPQEQTEKEVQINSTGGELQEIVTQKVRRITIKGQIDGE